MFISVIGDVLRCFFYFLLLPFLFILSLGISPIPGLEMLCRLTVLKLVGIPLPLSLPLGAGMTGMHSHA